MVDVEKRWKKWVLSIAMLWLLMPQQGICLQVGEGKFKRFCCVLNPVECCFVSCGTISLSCCFVLQQDALGWAAAEWPLWLFQCPQEVQPPPLPLFFFFLPKWHSWHSVAGNLEFRHALQAHQMFLVTSRCIWSLSWTYFSCSFCFSFSPLIEQ